MASSAERSDPVLWERIKHEITAGDKGGNAGEWSARKAQMAVQRYKAEGGGYKGRKAADNHLSQWTREEWDTKSGEASKETGERYLPKHAREALSDKEYARTTAKKRADMAKGKQFSAQPADIAAKTADARLADLPRAELLKRAAQHKAAGRSRMKKDELLAALAHHACRAIQFCRLGLSLPVQRERRHRGHPAKPGYPPMDSSPYGATGPCWGG